ncbi:hypothetical protein BC833DRAFT_617851 [Globomyces pollinis-pini]|nr:hypothetical protein BC833DRAFT_617851 [Globomyces pollinis-pini]KAJ2997838.1 hypothetical protein HDV02_005108 [Globomyces sp. JEL0801]
MSETIRQRKDTNKDDANKQVNDIVDDTSKGKDTSDTIISKNSVYSKIPGNVLLKLIVFSIMAITVPLMTFFYGLETYGSTVSGIMAACSANVVLVMYIVVAFLEED